MTASLTVGLIGAGYMGRAHAIAFHGVGATFGAEYAVRCVSLADHSPERAHAGARALGFEHAATSWQDLVRNPDIDVVDICAPNYLHREMTLAALANGKHVYCEKPLATTLADAREVARAARLSGRCCLIGFNYICNPHLQLAREMIAGGLRATLCCVDSQQLDASFSGREFDAALLADLPESVDPCGENGEFHTCVHAGPMFARPLALASGERVLRDARFAYTDFSIVAR